MENAPDTIVGKQKDIPVYKVEPVTGTGKMKMRVLHRNMLFPLAMDTQWEGTSATVMSSSAEGSKDEYVSAEEEDIGYSRPVTEALIGNHSMWQLPPKPTGY